MLELDLETLGRLDNGAALKQFALLLKQARQDIEGRPGVKDARKLVIKVALKPKSTLETDESGHGETILHGVAVGIEFDLKLPARKTFQYDMGIDNGKIVFNPNSPFDHRQQTLFDDEQTVDGSIVPIRSQA